ncbi:MAG: hypothetical protein NVS9B10_03290 [Nevskia sp.]
MKTSKTAGSKIKAAAAKAPAGKPKKKLRTRLTGVRGRVLGLLADGPLTSSELVSKGGFSAASLYLNLKALKKDGMVKTIRNGRSVSISLTGAPEPAAAEGAAMPTPKAAAKTKAKSALVKAYVPRDLHEALEGLTRRLSPIERADEKLRTLEQLARSLPSPVASVLKDIMGDLARLSSAD